MEIIYIFVVVLGVATILFNWDKLRNNENFSKSIDSVMKFIFLNPFKLLFVTIPCKIWEKIKTGLQQIWQWAWPRPLILFSSTLSIIILYCLVNSFDKSTDDGVNLIFKYFVPDNGDKPIYNTLIPLLLGALPAFFIWSWRNNDKRKDQTHKEKELDQKDREFNFYERNYAHDKFTEYRKILKDESNNVDDKLYTAYELGNYYNKSGTYPQMVHTVLKENLKAYWEKHQTETQVPIYIQALYDVLDKQDKIFVSKELSLSGFHLNYYKPSRKDLSNLDLSKVVWNHAYLYKANLSGTNFEDASLKEAKMISTNLEDVRFFCTDLRGSKFEKASFRKTDLGNANLIGADLRIKDYDNETIFNGAIYLESGKKEKFKKILEEVKDNTYSNLLRPTIFPLNFKPEEHGMIEVCEYYEINKSLP